MAWPIGAFVSDAVAKHPANGKNMNIEVNVDQATQIGSSARPTNLKSGMEVAADFANRANRLDQALQSLAELTGEETSRSVARLRRTLAEFEPSVTLLGQVKSGKTSLVNAMAGWADLLPSDVNPWTSVVTSLHLTPGRKRCEIGARFKFMTEEEWNRLLTRGGRLGELAGRSGADSELTKIQTQVQSVREKARQRLGRKFELLLGQEHEYGFFDRNLLERYTCLGDDFDSETSADDDDGQGKFADITRSADLYLNSQTVPFPICLRDTPGVNDTFMMREQVTIRAVRDSRVCVVVLSANQALTSVDMGLIRLISNLKSREVIFFVNRIDELPDPVNQIPEIEASMRQTLRDHHGPGDAEIIFGSAFWANSVLSGALEDMPETSSGALLDWAQVAMSPADQTQSSPNIVWEISGLPALFRCISDRVVKDEGNALLAKIANSGASIASGLQAVDAMTIEGETPASTLSMYEVTSRFKTLADSQLEALQTELDEVIATYHDRADRTHLNFVERATHSLITHLEHYGDTDVWEYDPAGLRMLLRSAYNVFGVRMQSAAKKRYETAVGELAELYCQAFGSAVHGIQISLPEVPSVPSPVALGQTIALDFRDGWWISWWRRTRGYKAFAKRFQQLITAETEDFMTQLKTVQTQELRDKTVQSLTDFLDEQRNILFELGSQAGGGKDLQGVFSSGKSTKDQKNLQGVMDTLAGFSECPE